MTSLTRITCLAVHAMPPHEREALARELYPVHAQIFGGLGYEEFRDYVVERPAWRTWIYLKHNPAGQLVGYHSMHAFHLVACGRRSTVVRMEAGTLPAHRGRDLTMVYAVLRLLRVWLSQPWRRFGIFAALTHPSSYTFLSHYAPVIWPHADRPAIPPRMLRLMEELAASFELERVDPARPLVRRVDWVTLESAEEQQRWLRSKRRDTRFYIANNPGYAEGHGLLTYIPFNGAILVSSLVRFLVGRAGRLARLVFGDHRPEAPADPQATLTGTSQGSTRPRVHPEWAHTRPPSL